MPQWQQQQKLRRKLVKVQKFLADWWHTQCCSTDTSNSKHLIRPENAASVKVDLVCDLASKKRSTVGYGFSSHPSTVNKFTDSVHGWLERKGQKSGPLNQVHHGKCANKRSHKMLPPGCRKGWSFTIDSFRFSKYSGWWHRHFSLQKCSVTEKMREIQVAFL